MKLAMEKNTRGGVLCITGLLMIIMSFMLVKNIMYPGFKEEKKSLYNYSDASNIDYKVLLKPNVLYGNGAVLGEGNVIFSEFLDTIKTNFKYQFNGERAADISGNYNIIARLEGSVSTDKGKKTIWRKEFPLVQNQSFQSKDRAATLEKEISIKPNDYKSFAQNFVTTSKIDSQTTLYVIMNVSLKAATDSGNINVEKSIAMTIPLSLNYFEITKNTAPSKLEALQKVEKVKLPVNKKNVTACSAVLVVLALIIIYVAFFTEGIEKSGDHKRMIDKIFKSYGDRMVALSDSISFMDGHYYKVKSIEDLIRVSDELVRPIMYVYNSNAEGIKQFFVADDKFTYIFDMDTMKA